jgi:hypothetical protein
MIVLTSRDILQSSSISYFKAAGANLSKRDVICKLDRFRAMKKHLDKLKNEVQLNKKLYKISSKEGCGRISTVDLPKLTGNLLL